MPEQDVTLYTTREDRRVLRGARLLRAGPSLDRSSSDFHLVQLGVQLQDSDRIDFYGDGYDGRRQTLPSGGGESITGLEDLQLDLAVGSVIVARVTTVGKPLSFEGTSVQVVVGWKQSA